MKQLLSLFLLSAPLFAQAPSDSLESLENSTVKIRKQKQKRLTLRDVEGTSIYAGKKTEIVDLENSGANLATNNARQVFARTAGINVQESDGAGIQLGIGARGLSPKRTAEFNTRQNGYDMSADALGYPESYYTPPTEALKRIEVVRGAASLQYGPQFGGMVNFVLKDGPSEKGKNFEIVSRQTMVLYENNIKDPSNYGTFNSFNSMAGSWKGGKAYGFLQVKNGNGYRPNSEFNLYAGYGHVEQKVSKRLTLGADITMMHYLAQQAGGLLDNEFKEDPTESKRKRNWFQVDWKLFAFNLDYKSPNGWKLNSRSFALLAGRDAVGVLNNINQTDSGNERDLFVDDYLNFGNETRFLQRYSLWNLSQTFLAGFRLYQGTLTRQAGLASKSSDADFSFLKVDPKSKFAQSYGSTLKESDYTFPSQNAAFFVENIFRLHDQFALIPGIRYEWIRTQADGNHSNLTRAFDTDWEAICGSGQQALENCYDASARTPDKDKSTRHFPLFGLGSSYTPTPSQELYFNISQNYRAINFNDIKVSTPNFKVAEDIKDETGFNLDIGWRGQIENYVQYDISLFYLAYADRIGVRWQKDPSSGIAIQVRDNQTDSRNLGIESFIQTDLLSFFENPKDQSLELYSNLTLLDSRYMPKGKSSFNLIEALSHWGNDTSKDWNQVELVPSFLWRLGLQYKIQQWQISYQFSHTSRQFSDTENTIISSNASVGEIPSYQIHDTSIKWKSNSFYGIETGVNNLLDASYISQRASAYPGPGIIPSDGRSYYLTLEAKF